MVPFCIVSLCPSLPPSTLVKTRQGSTRIPISTANRFLMRTPPLKKNACNVKRKKKTGAFFYDSTETRNKVLLPLRPFTRFLFVFFLSASSPDVAVCQRHLHALKWSRARFKQSTRITGVPDSACTTSQLFFFVYLFRLFNFASKSANSALSSCRARGLLLRVHFVVATQPVEVQHLGAFPLSPSLV